MKVSNKSNALTNFKPNKMQEEALFSLKRIREKCLKQPMSYLIL